MKNQPGKDLTKRFALFELVTIALLDCGGSAAAIDTEDVAVRVNEIAPGRFTWRKHKDQINLELVRVTLSDAKKEKNRALITGDGSSGWSLTPAGLDWANANVSEVLNQNHAKDRSERRGGSIDEARWRRECTRVKQSSAWHRWGTGDPALTESEAKEVFRIDDYTSDRSALVKINRLKDLFSEDQDLLRFINGAAKAL